MLDIEGQIDYWRHDSREDWDIADKLTRDGRTRHGLFFAHLALEKALKALVVRCKRDVPPRIHSLTRLSELAGLDPSDRQFNVLADMNQFNLEGRYTEFLASEPSSQEASEYMARSQEILEWLMQQS